MKVECAVISDAGKVRGNNEDNFFLDGVWKENVGETHCEADIKKEGSRFAFAVSDGMGGEALGEFASLSAVEAMQVIKEKGWSEHAAEEFLALAKQKMKEYGDAKGQEEEVMGSALAVFVMEQRQGYAVNLGDSRLYLFRGRALRQLSKDHTQAQLLVEHGLLSEEEARKHRGGHALTRFLGNCVELSGEDFYQKEILLKKNDLFLLCSDGLTDMLEQREIELLLKKSCRLPVKKIAEYLYKAAMDAGGKDNITCLLVRIKQR